MARLVWHVEAVSDLDAVAEFIARDSTAQASSFVARIVAAAERLRDHPTLGRGVPELQDASCRELIFQNYRIVYRIHDDRVTILGIIHGAMDMQRQVRDRSWDIT